MSDWTPDICIYHFPCDDGFAAAWVARRRWPGIDLRPTNYGAAVPDEAIDGKNLLIADFSFKPDVLDGLAARAKTIVILDHHKSAQADLRGVPEVVRGAYQNVDRLFARMSGPGMNVLAEFDMNRSGAMMTWHFCFPGEKPPRLIRHVQDRDLWKFEDPDTRAFTLFLRSHPYDFDVWTDIAEDLDEEGHPSADVMREAHAIERYYDQRIAEMVQTATVQTIATWTGVPVAHAPYAFTSDLANALLKAHPDAPFAAVIVDAYGSRTYSLRSEDSRTDVSEVARHFGGGGHRNAAGFRSTQAPASAPPAG